MNIWSILKEIWDSACQSRLISIIRCKSWMFFFSSSPELKSFMTEKWVKHMTLSIFDENWGVWIANETLSPVISSQSKQKLKSKWRSKIIRFENLWYLRPGIHTSFKVVNFFVLTCFNLFLMCLKNLRPSLPRRLKTSLFQAYNAKYIVVFKPCQSK